MQQYQKVISLKFCYCRIWGGVAFDIPLGRKSACVGPRKDCEISLLVLLVHGPRSAFIMFIYALVYAALFILSKLASGEPVDTFSEHDQEEIGCWQACRFRHITLTELDYTIIYE